MDIFGFVFLGLSAKSKVFSAPRAFSMRVTSNSVYTSFGKGYMVLSYMVLNLFKESAKMSLELVGLLLELLLELLLLLLYAFIT